MKSPVDVALENVEAARQRLDELDKAQIADMFTEEVFLGPRHRRKSCRDGPPGLLRRDGSPPA